MIPRPRAGMTRAARSKPKARSEAQPSEVGTGVKARSEAQPSEVEPGVA